MEKWIKGISIVASMWYFACAMKHLFITGSLFWEIMYIIPSALFLGYAIKEDS